MHPVGSHAYPGLVKYWHLHKPLTVHVCLAEVPDLLTSIQRGIYNHAMQLDLLASTQATSLCLQSADGVDR
jgi:hypothetical protein